MIKIMKHALCLLILQVFYGCDNRPIDLVKLYYEKGSLGDTTGVREIFHDKIIQVDIGKYTDTLTKHTLLGNILTKEIDETHSSIKEILIFNDTLVKLISIERPTYLYRKHQPSDTIEFIMTYYFFDNRIYKILIDTMIDANYCYYCNSNKRDQHLDSFFNYLMIRDPEFHMQLSDYYESMSVNPELFLKNTIWFETRLKEYYLEWTTNNE